MLRAYHFPETNAVCHKLLQPSPTLLKPISTLLSSTLYGVQEAKNRLHFTYSLSNCHQSTLGWVIKLRLSNQILLAAIRCQTWTNPKFTAEVDAR